MKRILLCSCLFMVAINHIQAQPLEISSQIESVTVYPQRAQVTRVAEVNLPPGNTELVLTQLSPKLIQSSFRLSLGSNNASVREVSYRNNYLNTVQWDERSSELYEQLDSLREAEKWATYQKQIIQGEEAILDANQRVYSNQQGVSVSALQELSEYYRNRLTELRQQQLKIEIRLAKLKEQEQVIKNQINSLSAQKNKEVAGEVTVSIQTQTATQTTIRVSYLVNNAGWSPSYDIRATSMTDPLDVTFRAAIRQNTGQDWNGVELSLSNAKPVMNNTQPKLNPLYARKMQPSYDTVANISPETYEETYRIVRSEPKPKKWSDTENKLTSTLFNLTRIDQIPSNGKDQMVTIWEKQIPAKIQYLCIPRKAPFVYLIAEIVDYGQYQLEAGKANIFNEGTFVGTVNLNAEDVTDTLQLSLGIDQSINVEREGRDFSERKWMGSDRKETYEFNLCLRNNKAETVEVLLLDQIPISTDKDIEIELLQRDGAQYNARTGSLQWTAKCKPNQSACRRYSYSVKYPKGTAVSGKW
mgnify:CR=1 FL=1